MSSAIGSPRFFLFGSVRRGIRARLESKRKKKEPANSALAPIPSTDPRLAAVYENYRANLTDIAEAGKSAGAKVVLCTVPVNLRDCAPFGSAHHPGFGEKETADYQRDLHAARAAFREGRIDEASTAATALTERDPQFAEAHFLLGRIRWQKAFWDDARAGFTSALELDTIRLRAETGGNTVVRRVATSAGASLADLEKALAAAEKTPHRVPGRELFLEHVHLRFIGNYFAALAILEQLQGVGPAPSSEDCAAALAYTPFDAAEDNRQGMSIISRPPFTLQSNHEEELETLRREHAALVVEATKPDALRAQRAQYEKVLAERPDDYWVHGNFAELLQKIGDRPAEVATRERIVALRPEDVHARLRLATACWATDAPRAQRLLEEAERDLVPTPQTYKTLGDQFLANHQLEPAAARYREALRLWAEYPEAMQNLAAVLVRQQQPEEAAHLLERALKVQDDATSRHNLAGILVRAGRHAEAVPHYERLVQLEPKNGTSHLQLGRALLNSGRLDEAETTLQAAEKLSPTPRVYIAMGEVAERRRQWSEAEFRYRKALRLEEGSVIAGQKLAWVLSTSPDVAARDPREAERLLRSLMAAAPGPSPELLDAMAACQAAQARFSLAIDMARRAAQLATDAKMPELAAAIRGRLELYEKGQPYVQGAGK